MGKAILVLNCGSSSIKYQVRLLPDATLVVAGRVERIGEPTSIIEHTRGGQTVRSEQPVASHEAGLRAILHELTSVSGSDTVVGDSISEISAVGHRVVHGGEAFSGSVRIDDRVIQTIRDCVDLAPLHNPANLAGIEAARQALPDVPHVACFDTAFHATIPKVAALYGLPFEMYEKHRVRRYGFHGSSHRYVSARAAQFAGIPSDQLHAITCHLGNGCSVAAIRGGLSVDTSMGLTPLEGLIMGTRCGDIDPAILFYLVDKGYDITRLNDLCNKKSGLLGISGLSNDMRTLQENADRGHALAQLAVEMFCYRVKKYLGAYYAVLGHVDAIVFTGGIGEHAVGVRARICSGLEPLGIELDATLNQAAHHGDRAISTLGSRVRVLVIPTDEEAVIAQDTYELVAQ